MRSTAEIPPVQIVEAVRAGSNDLESLARALNRSEPSVASLLVPLYAGGWLEPVTDASGEQVAGPGIYRLIQLGPNAPAAPAPEPEQIGMFA